MLRLDDIQAMEAELDRLTEGYLGFGSEPLPGLSAPATALRTPQAGSARVLGQSVV